jgi:threonine dehydrogenase-like Zn-dependent dehydrogenase
VRILLVDDEADFLDAVARGLRREGYAVDTAMDGAEALAKAGTLAIIGVYPQSHNAFPIGTAMNKNITMRMGNANHKKYVQELVELVRRGGLRPEHILSQMEPMTDVIAAYETFDAQNKGWVKVELNPAP